MTRKSENIVTKQSGGDGAGIVTFRIKGGAEGVGHLLRQG